MYNLFVLSEFRLLPDEMLKKPAGALEMIRAFLHKAIEEKNISVRLCNLIKDGDN